MWKGLLHSGCGCETPSGQGMLSCGRLCAGPGHHGTDVDGGTWQMHGLRHSGQVPTAPLFSFCKYNQVNCKLAVNLPIKNVSLSLRFMGRPRRGVFMDPGRQLCMLLRAVHTWSLRLAWLTWLSKAWRWRALAHIQCLLHPYFHAFFPHLLCSILICFQ